MAIIRVTKICEALANRPIVEVSAVLDGDAVTELHCPLRSAESICMRVDVDRLPCWLISDYPVSDDAIFSEEKT